MKVAVVSFGVEQIARKNIAEPNGLPYFSEFDYDKLWGTPIDPEGGIRPDLLILKGFFVSDAEGWYKHLKIFGDYGRMINDKCHAAERIIILWSGSDTIALGEYYNQLGKYCPKLFTEIKSNRFLHIPVSGKQREDLRELFGLSDTVALELPSPARKVFQFLPMPEKLTVAFYLPTFRADFYRYALIPKLAKLMPDVKFIVYHWFIKTPHLQLAESQDNVEYRFGCSRVEYEQVIAESSVLLRVPVHDGLSSGAAEFMMAGRPVLSCWDMPKWERIVRFPNDPDEVAKNIRKTKLVVPENVAEHYRGLFDPHKWLEKLSDRTEKAWGIRIPSPLS